MANRYAAAIAGASVAVTGGGVCAEIGSSGRTTIRSIEITQNTTTGVAAVVGIGRPANTPTVGTAVNPIATDPADAATTAPALYASWTTAPTIPGTFMKRAGINAGMGNGVIWNFEPDKWVVGTTRNLSLVVWIISLATATATVLNVAVEFAD